MNEILAVWAWPALFAGLLLTAAVSDVARRKVPNWTVAALVVTYAVAAWFGVAPASPASALGAAAIAFAIGYGLYHFDIVGAGDAKLISAVALFVGLANLATLGLLTVLTGGAIAIGYLIFRPQRVMRGLTARGRAEGAVIGVPYGVAIAVGGVLTGLLSKNFFPLG